MNFSKIFDKAEYSLSVSTGQMSAKAAQIKNICSDILRHIKVIEECVDNSPNYWDADSSVLMRSIFSEDKEKILIVKENLKRQIDNLNRIIMLYEASEKASVSDTETLPDGIID